MCACGAPKALAMAIRNMEVLKRNTRLKERINPLLAVANTAAPIQSPKIASYPNLHAEEENLPIAAEPETSYHKSKG